MLFSKASLLSLAGIIGIATAGPKAPKSPRAVSRRYSNSSGVILNILTKTGVKNTTVPDLYGWMFEDINHSGDGGLYGELLTNRAFDGSDVTWGNVSTFIGDSIVYQENTCEAFGKYTTAHFTSLAHQLEALSLQDTSQWGTHFSSRQSPPLDSSSSNSPRTRHPCDC